MTSPMFAQPQEWECFAFLAANAQEPVVVHTCGSFSIRRMIAWAKFKARSLRITKRPWTMFMSLVGFYWSR